MNLCVCACIYVCMLCMYVCMCCIYCMYSMYVCVCCIYCVSFMYVSMCSIHCMYYVFMFVLYVLYELMYLIVFLQLQLSIRFKFTVLNKSHFRILNL